MAKLTGSRPARMVALGKIVGAHGVRGELKVVSYSGSLAALEGSERVFVSRRGEEPAARVLLGLRPHKGAFLVMLGGVASREEARALAGSELALPADELPPLEDDEYYWYQLVGLEVITEAGERLGRVEEIMATGAADILVVRGDGGGPELLLPATPEVVKRVELAEGTMVVEPPEGLLPGEG